MALSMGMNREYPSGSLTQKEYERRRRLWWTVYIIDRKLSINMGAPLTISDEEIDISMPAEIESGFSNSALILHIKLAALEGNVMTGIVSLWSICDFTKSPAAAYKINGTLDKAFIIGLQNIFSKMTTLVEEFETKFDLGLNTPRGVSRVAATLHIMYYQVFISSSDGAYMVYVDSILNSVL